MIGKLGKEVKALKKILIVEDDQLLNRTLAYNLTSDGYEVISVFNFDSAVRKLRENEFDVALLDINLPDGSGLDLCEEIRNRGQHTYIIFITANDKESDMLKGYEVGGADYVTKPFSVTVLCKKVAAVFANLELRTPRHDLFDDGFEAVYIGSGAGLPRFMGIPGESLKEVYSANEYLTRVNLMKAYQPGSTTPIYHARKVAVVGGGNVAMDAARSAIRLGAEEVYVLYRRSFEEIPARQEEVQHAQEEQIRFQTLTNPVEILGSDDGNVTGVRCIRMELGEPDATGRRRPVPVPDSDFVIDADCVIMAIGTSPNPLIKSTTGGLDVNARGGIVADENGCTSRDGVFAGGDTVTGAATVIKAMGAGKIAAKSIDAYIQNR